MKESLSKSIIGSFFKVKLLIGVVSFPFLFDCINVENSFFLTVLDYLRGRGAH
jgi:hypothetical protein